MTTQGSNNTNKKIKPVEHPDLVLKSPIAYHGGTDLSVIPIDKDGIAVCEKCGAIGVKHAFYTKQRKFCSLSCARSYTGLINVGKEYNMNQSDLKYDNLGDIQSNRRSVNYKFRLMENTDHLVGMIPMEPFPQLPGMWQPVVEDFMQPISHKMGNVNTYDWQNELITTDFMAAPVSLFHHAPRSDKWDEYMCGIKVEIKNRDCGNMNYKLSDYYWVATVLKLKGYMALLRYEGFGNDESQDFWVNLTHPEVHHVGWCAIRGKPVIAPHSISNKYSDWKSFLVLQLTCAKTLPTGFYDSFSSSLRSRFRIGHVMEVVDKNRICQVKVAIVHEIVGKRLHIRYYDSTPEDNGFWCHEDSPLIHPVGWAHEVGHLLDAPFEYLERLKENISNSDDTTPDMFKTYTMKDPHNVGFNPTFTEGMKLEAIDPLNLSSICVATVMKVLLHGYIMIRVDCYPPDESGSDWFCYHRYSPCIFPTGFCNERGIPVTVASGQVPTPTNFISSYENAYHGFTVGMRLECADLMDPRLVCVATVAGVVGRLLKVHFNGWGDEYDQWLDCESTDIYPVGWCQAVGHKLEGPCVQVRQPVAPHRKKGRKRKIKVLNEQPKHSKVLRVSEPACEVSNDGSYDTLPDAKNEDQSFVFSNESKEIENSLESQLKNLNELENNMEFEMKDKDFLLNESNDFMEDLNLDQSVEEHVNEEKREQKIIPRLIGTTVDTKTLEAIQPESWETEDVAQFLTLNDCAPYCLNFCHITGKTMLDLTKDEIIELLQMKVGPSLKIYDLIQQLKCKLKPVQARKNLK